MHIPDKFHLMLFFNSTENWGAFQISVTEPSVLFCNMMNDLFCHVDSKSAALERLRRCICCAVSVCRLCALCVAHIRSSIQWFQLSIQGLLNIAPYMSQEATWRWRKNRRGVWAEVGVCWWGGWWKNSLQMKCETKSTATSFFSPLQHPPHPPHPSQMTLLLLSRGDRIGLVTSSVLARECWAERERERGP